MTKLQLYVFIVELVTDFIIAAAAALGGGVIGTGEVELPGKGVIFVACVAGLVSAARTAQTIVRRFIPAMGAESALRPLSLTWPEPPKK